MIRESGDRQYQGAEIDPMLEEVLGRVGEKRSFAKGTILYEEGFPCPMVPLILSGVVRVFKMGETGREITLYRVEPGQICVLSSTCALTGKEAKLPAIAVAETDVELLAVPSHVFRKQLANEPQLQSHLNQILTERLSEMMMVIDEVAFGRVDIRLAEELLRGCRGTPGAEVTATHAQLAMELGSAREVVSRVLKEFERQGMVRLGRGRIKVLDPDRLREFVQSRG